MIIAPVFFGVNVKPGGKTMAVKPIPDGYHSVTPYLIIKGADRAIDYYKNVFGASQRMRMGRSQRHRWACGNRNRWFRDHVGGRVPGYGIS